jgi:hypothetical protein
MPYAWVGIGVGVPPVIGIPVSRFLFAFLDPIFRFAIPDPDPGSGLRFRFPFRDCSLRFRIYDSGFPVSRFPPRDGVAPGRGFRARPEGRSVTDHPASSSTDGPGVNDSPGNRSAQPGAGQRRGLIAGD